MSGEGNKVYLCRLTKKVIIDAQPHEKPLDRKELTKIFTLIRFTKLDLKEKPSRYLNPGLGNEPYIIFPEDHIGKIIPKNDDYINGLFLKRRKENWPHIDNGKGILKEITTDGKYDEITESILFSINKRTRILLWISNKHVGGLPLFTDYINQKFKEALQANSGIEGLSYKDKEAFVDSIFLTRTNSYDRFKQTVDDVSFIEFRVSGDLNTQLSSEAGDLEELVGKMCSSLKDNNIYSVLLKMSAPRGKNGKINKKLVDSFFKLFNKESYTKFQVSGRNKTRIDDQTEVFDLLSDKFIYYVNFPNQGKYINYESQFNKLRKIHEENWKEIEKTTGVRKDNSVDFSLGE